MSFLEFDTDFEYDEWFEKKDNERIRNNYWEEEGIEINEVKGDNGSKSKTN